jgi:hypothetical protein
VDSLAADGTSGFVMAGVAIGTVSLGATSLPSSGHGADLLVLKVDHTGHGVWGQRAGSDTGASGYQVAVNAGHVAAITGISRTGSIDFGTGSLGCTGVCAVAATVGP